MSKLLPVGKAYACPKCGKPLVPEKGPWDILHCYPCNDSVDLWHDKTPEIIEVPA